MADSLDQLMRIGDVFRITETSDQDDGSRENTDTQLAPAPEQCQSNITTTLSSSPDEVFHGRILDILCSTLELRDSWNFGLTCKILLKNVLETLSRAHDRALLTACTRGELRLLRDLRRPGRLDPSSLDRHLNISELEFVTAFGPPIAAAVSLRPTPLTLALNRGHLGVAEYLIDQGADVNLPEGELDDDEKVAFSPQPSRWYPIHFAVLLTGNREGVGDAMRVLKKLLDRGASADQRTIECHPLAPPKTPLTQAISSSVSLGALKLLLAYGAKPSWLNFWVRRHSYWVKDFADLLRKRALQRALGGYGSENGRELIVKSALLLFSLSREQPPDPLVSTLMAFDSPSLETEILLVEEELQVAADLPWEIKF